MTHKTTHETTGQTTSEPNRGVSAIEFRNVSYRYDGQNIDAVERIDLSVDVGERLGVLGPNGGGKSTLLRLAMGLIRPTTGEVRVLGMTGERARRDGCIASVPQRSAAELAFPLSVRQVVLMPLAARVAPWKRLAADLREAGEHAIDLVGAREYADHPIGALSGGQLQLTLIARAIACRPRILVLDEPMVGVDVSGQQRFSDLLAKLHAELGLTIMIVSHDLRAIAAGCDRVACLNRTLHSHGSPLGLTPQVLAEVFSHDVEAFFGEVHVDAHAASECDNPEHEHGHGHSHTSGNDHGDPPAREGDGS